MMTSIKKAFGPFLVLLAMLAVPSAASAASIQFSLNQSNSLGAGPFGSVVLTQTVAQALAGEVDVAVLLNAGNGFVDTGGTNHPDFAWTLDPAIGLLSAADITILKDGLDNPANPATGSWNWVFDGAVTTSDSLGTFGYSFRCSDDNPPAGTQRCGPGSGNANPGPFEFLITKPGLTLASFVPSTGDGQHYFVADIINGQAGGNGQTGLVWADGGVRTDDFCTGTCASAVPEPASMVLLGTGLLGLASKVRRRGRTS